MNILITGISGFVGSNLMRKIGTEDNMIFADEGDLSEKKTLDRLKNYKIEHIFHLASLINIKESWENPYEYYKVNVLSTINVLEFAREHNSNVTFTSSYVYGEPDYIPIDEKHVVKGYNPYSQTKIMSEMLCTMYMRNYGMNITILRVFNIYGKGQKTLLIPTITDMLYSDDYKNIEVPNENIVRDYINIDDVVDVLILTLKSHGGIYNLGSGKGISVKHIKEHLCNITGIQKDILIKSRGISNEILTIIADISKLKNDFQWKPKVNIVNGLKEYIEWYNQNK